MAYNELYQYSVVSSLMEGIGETGIPYSELVTHGNHGLGTFRRMAGEMICLDNEVYQMKSDGSIVTIDPSTGNDVAPFAMVTRFQPSFTTSIAFDSKQGLSDIMTTLFPKTKNRYLSFRLDGLFKELHQRQTTYEFTDVRGSLIGFRSPEFLQGVSVAGDHLHFISDERDRGGHVLDCKSAGEVQFSGSIMSTVHMQLPDDDEYNEADLELDDDGIRKVEG
ncbi:alpha-acetolactate decarboxylase domain-containing protein [Trichoderma breve]|uniref:Alpha-acetolactate decarboxylase n=1 Tax=Trichoderma breve TaxID=2034170 RepID=A0A9W9E731_9HYPO|nr:alpha-acetolactate decarboxylase domain-containing protein [Trichoderma breve]KAJ4861468.1 alpha-acetolactate decarboxylase domain-containing protein [Trichoderma breve]